MPPTDHASRLREMAEYESAMAKSYANTALHVSDAHERTAAALLAGAEALEAIERADKCLDGISVPAVQCFDRAAEIADLAEALDAWAWLRKTEATVEPYWHSGGWRLVVSNRIFEADTPIGAVRAAIEGEKEKKDE